MKLLFCPLYEADQEEVIKNSKDLPNFAISNFNEKLINGLYLNLEQNLSVVSTRTIAAFPKYRRIINSRKKIKYKKINIIEIFTINLPIIKYFFETISLYHEIKSWVETNKEEDSLYICSYGRRISHALSINRIKKKYKKVRTCMIYGDLSGNLATKTKNESNYIKSLLIDWFLEFSISQSIKMDCSIFLTEQMREVLNYKKPYLVIEGVCNENMLNDCFESENTMNKCVVMYTGILSKKYAIDILIDSFQYLDESKYELLLYGIGDLVDELKCLNKSNIKFMGYINSSEISVVQKKADILINPRQNNEIFTKYSFPSKTLEYLSTGKPVICYKLDGIPNDYDEYLFYIKGNSAIDIANKIKEVYSLDIRKKESYYNQVIRFLKTKKTSEIQCRKIIEFLTDI